MVVYCSLGCGVKVRKMDMDLHQVYVGARFHAINFNPENETLPESCRRKKRPGTIVGAHVGS